MLANILKISRDNCAILWNIMNFIIFELRTVVSKGPERQYTMHERTHLRQRRRPDAGFMIALKTCDSTQRRTSRCRWTIVRVRERSAMFADQSNFVFNNII